VNINPFDLIKSIQSIQANVGEMQGKLKSVTVTGSAGGDMVSITVNGQMEILAVHISKEAVDPNDIEMLQDLLTAAFNDAFSKIKEKIREEMSAISGGIPIPPGLMGM